MVLTPSMVRGSEQMRWTRCPRLAKHWSLLTTCVLWDEPKPQIVRGLRLQAVFGCSGEMPGSLVDIILKPELEHKQCQDLV